ncbi:glycosyltransferase [Flavobacterium sp. GSP27]|uniref:glycosyltransferase family 2 protein n=1 Tax=unclassified Flavobacterium TaxID=196869 RepID=UPI000F83BC35|nr:MULTISPECIES: glycosyltransferase [unclassified Flavobacterium]RTY94232.1 glycosyltransferase [Flavobacterium sp. GSN2]RTY66190.1 glycosyltransferase [Flavobacterium sp. LB2P53]RTY74194.1 glycosyltransferase [Flavobacterium sp. LS1R10]RTY83532.1 glycosyltransferase [Flavobacterium sp. LS1P28]RTY83679.1 glycosyltransferase [Flavobacterium sp. ZB4P23]
MQDNPLVTVICLCYNHKDYVIESLMSVLNQHYDTIELIIVDDCSTDNSKSVIEKWLLDYPQIPFIANDTNLGNTKSFNNALKTAKGDYIIDLAADDVLLPNCITSQINAFNNTTFKNLGIVYGNVELITEKGKHESYYFPVDSFQKVVKERTTGDIYESVLSGGDCICSVSSMVKKSLFDALNGYDETLAYEDLDFWIRASRTYEFDFIDAILVQKRIVHHSLGTHFFKKKDARARKINQSTYLILKKAIGLNRTKKEDKAILKRIHFEMILTYKTAHNTLLLRYIIMEIKLRFHLLAS